MTKFVKAKIILVKMQTCWFMFIIWLYYSVGPIRPNKLSNALNKVP